MSDDANIRRDYIFSADAQQQAKQVDTWVTREERKIKKKYVGLWAGNIIQAFVIILLSSALFYATPLIRLIPVFFYAKPDGILETAITTDSLTDQLRDADIQAWLWQYVRAREGYSYLEMDYNNRVVQAMSSQPVREAYQEWSSGKNPESYQAKLGKKGIVRVERDAVADYQESRGGQPGRIIFHYDRYVQIDGEPKQPKVTYTVVMGFIVGYRTGFNVKDILEFNPSRIVVTAYPGSEEVAPRVGTR